VGPLAKVSPDSLPKASNLHYLGPKRYEDLPAYLAGWDVAMMPFARNEATRFISPTKTPEYLAGGCPVVSTSIRDVVSPYAQHGVVEIGDNPTEFVSAIERALDVDVQGLRERADGFLEGHSWDRTWRDMESLVLATVARKRRGVAVPSRELHEGVVRLPIAFSPVVGKP
jgi:glycosyltransferase involved in cell wall biosynthesis